MNEMTASKVSAVRYGSIHSMDNMPGSEHHRRTSSLTNRTRYPEYSTPSRLSKEQTSKLNNWKYPASVATTASDTAQSPSPGLLSSAHLNRIEESPLNSDSDDSFDSNSSPSRSHRSSPSLPYGPLTTPYSTQAYKQPHSTSRLLRFDRATLLRFLFTSFKKLTLSDIGYGLIFFSCFCVFMAALTGIGYRPLSLERLPLPTSTSSFELGRRAQELNNEVLLREEMVEALRKLAPDYPEMTPQESLPRVVAVNESVEASDDNTDEEEEEAYERRRPVQPLKAQPQENAAPLIITEEQDPADEELPLWAIPKAQRQARREFQEAAREAKAAPAPKVLPQEDRWVPAEQPPVEEQPDVFARDPMDSETEDNVTVSEEDLKALQDAEDEASLDERDFIAGEEASTSDSDEVEDDNQQILDSPADPVLNDEHAGHYHHRDGSNIYVKAPGADGHTHHSFEQFEEEMPPEEQPDLSDPDVDSEEVDRNEYEIVEKPDGTYAVQMKDGSQMPLEDWPQAIPEDEELVPDTEGVLDEEEQDFDAEDYKPRRAIALR